MRKEQEFELFVETPVYRSCVWLGLKFLRVYELFPCIAGTFMNRGIYEVVHHTKIRVNPTQTERYVSLLFLPTFRGCQVKIYPFWQTDVHLKRLTCCKWAAMSARHVDHTKRRKALEQDCQRVNRHREAQRFRAVMKLTGDVESAGFCEASGCVKTTNGEAVTKSKATSCAVEAFGGAMGACCLLWPH